ncbi:MAG: hypothetical protein ACL7BU_04550 [Candidatus Phlomobacter fragariae]
MLKSKRLEKVKKQFDQLNQLKVEVGVLKNTRPYKASDISVVEVATIHEFGTETIKPRSFLRMPIRDHQKAIIEKAVKEKYRFLISGEISAKEFLSYIGELAVTWSIEAFDTQGFGTWPDHAESTKAQLKRKGIIKARLLQDTGALKKSITYQVVKK